MGSFSSFRAPPGSAKLTTTFSHNSSFYLMKFRTGSTRIDYRANHLRQPSSSVSQQDLNLFGRNANIPV